MVLNLIFANSPLERSEKDLVLLWLPFIYLSTTKENDYSNYIFLIVECMIIIYLPDQFLKTIEFFAGVSVGVSMYKIRIR
jgi:hypothetical protein